MQFFRHRSPPITQGAAVTIGNFDGIHRGHQAMLYRLRDWAQRIGTPTVVVSFDPTPQQYFGTPVPRLSRFRAKWTALEEIGIHYFWCRRFDRILASQSAEDFIQQELVQKLKIRYLLVGEHFRFGRERQGDTALLTAAAAQYGFVFETIPLLQDPMPISSTAIRQALSAGDCAQAAQWLGRPYSLLGRVVHGSKRGRSIGFPTANIPCPNPPVRGVFIVWLQTPDQQWYAGVANVGRRPTFEKVGLYRLEVHLLSATLDLYGKLVKVIFIEKLRDEMHFETKEDLYMQICRDVAQARQYFEQQGASHDHDRL